MREAIWIALAIVGWGTWSVIEKLALRNSTPLMVPLINTYVYSALAPLIFLGMKARGDEFVWTKWGIIWTTLAALLATLANYAFLFAIESKPVHEVMSWTQTYPIFTFILCWAFLDERFTATKAVGSVLILAGALIMNR